MEHEHLILGVIFLVVGFVLMHMDGGRMSMSRGRSYTLSSPMVAFGFALITLGLFFFFWWLFVTVLHIAITMVVWIVIGAIVSACAVFISRVI